MGRGKGNLIFTLDHYWGRENGGGGVGGCRSDLILEVFPLNTFSVKYARRVSNS